MSIYIRVALAIDLVLCALQHGAPSITSGILPVGGSEFVELTVLLLLGVAMHELFSDRKQPPSGKDEVRPK